MKDSNEKDGCERRKGGIIKHSGDVYKDLKDGREQSIATKKVNK